jgi:hypothetical protein
MVLPTDDHPLDDIVKVDSSYFPDPHHAHASPNEKQMSA